MATTARARLYLTRLRPSLFEIATTTAHRCDADPSVCPDYCRCGVILEARVAEVSIPGIARELSSALVELTGAPLSTHHAYALDRILTARKVWDTTRWQPSWSRGYYGDELDSVSFDGDVELATQLAGLVADTPDQAIEAALLAEYGLIPPTLEGATYTVEELDLAEVSFGRTEYAASRPGTYPRELPDVLGVCRIAGREYRLVDGYHRTTAAITQGHAVGNFLLART